LLPSALFQNLLHWDIFSVVTRSYLCHLELQYFH